MAFGAVLVSIVRHSLEYVNPYVQMAKPHLEKYWAHIANHVGSIPIVRRAASTVSRVVSLALAERSAP